MRSSSLYFALSLASWAICAPAPIVFVEDLEVAVARATHPPVTAPNTRPKHALPLVVSGEIVIGEEHVLRVPIDNRPITPSISDEPSAVLASPHPIKTGYLLSLAKSRGSTTLRGPAAPESDRIEGGSLQKEEALRRTKDSLTITEMELTVEIPSSSRIGTGMPCHYARALAREHNDMLVVLLVVAFLLVVIIVETWESVCRR
ncbi:hypothetical protein QBC46DRAFT_48929 [Diplogelasinospora grovesii]|uniref:Uncharacterized protein n=1 Tax=Diplogelasinospora grovesii TaxID=303347 RepID=A0AAN6S7D1_9PEZI|nr:hypothetical protein QBC46DRAFT_48929 [Diplogelasinospora grovesii]